MLIVQGKAKKSPLCTITLQYYKHKAIQISTTIFYKKITNILYKIIVDVNRNENKIFGR